MNKEELSDIKGGVAKELVIGISGMIITFLIGLFDGYFRPLSCNK